MNKLSASWQFKLFMFLLTGGFIGFAFINSAMPADVSSNDSKWVLEFIQSIINNFGLNIELTEYFIRKTAHFTEYAAIGAMFMMCGYSFDKLKPYRYYSTMLFAGILTPVIDETIQLFVSGRSGQLTDVWIDFSGVITGLFVMFVILFSYVRIRKWHK